MWTAISTSTLQFEHKQEHTGELRKNQLDFTSGRREAQVHKQTLKREMYVDRKQVACITSFQWVATCHSSEVIATPLPVLRSAASHSATHLGRATASGLGRARCC